MIGASSVGFTLLVLHVTGAMAADCYSGAEVAGITIGVLIAVLAIIGIAVGIYLLRRKKQPKKPGGCNFG